MNRLNKYPAKGTGGQRRTLAAKARHFTALDFRSVLAALTGYNGLYIGPRGGWLYRKAVRTGEAYWWDCYEACRYGY